MINLSEGRWRGATGAGGSELSLSGRVFLDGGIIDAAGLSKLVAETEFDELAVRLQALNGFYAWVAQAPGRLLAGVDRIRSCPLFYAQVDGRLYLSDDAEWVRTRVGDMAMEPLACEEFQLAGYVTGADTLFARVKQLQAGEFLVARHAEGELTVQTHRYYRFAHGAASDGENTLRARLDEAIVAATHRLIEHAAGRQIVIPLSGGYDSRLIAVMLRRAGYDNVLCFTYGVPGNRESQYSRAVAQALGLRWHFVEYSAALWREAWQSKQRRDYLKWASGWNSIAVVQDWLAVREMTAGRVVERDAIFVPGHTGDFLSGGHIPEETFTRTEFDANVLCAAIMRKHYNISPLARFPTPATTWASRIAKSLGNVRCDTADAFADAFETWEWQERQAKFICNSVRAYEFFGHDWWMPLWDMEFMRFWGEVPLHHRRSKALYKSFVDDIGEGFGITLGNAADPSRAGLRRLAKAALPSAGLAAVRRLLRRKTSHPLMPYSRYPAGQCRKLVRQGYDLNGIGAHFFLGEAAAEGLKPDSIGTGGPRPHEGKGN